MASVNGKPLVSILIPLYNAEDWIDETVKSVLSQTWENKEIIVVNDGSTDDSLEIVRSINADELTIVTQRNRGACAARNRAFEVSHGDYVQYLDADDLLGPDKIETQLRRLSGESPGKLASTRWGVFEDDPANAIFEGGNEACRSFDDPIDWFFPWAHGTGGMRPHAWLTPRELIEESGPWNTDLKLNQDGEFFSRVLLLSDGVVFCPNTEVYYRETGTGVSSRRSQEAWKSLYDSIRLICSRILEREDSPRTRQLCAAKWEQFRRRAYPSCPDLVRRAKQNVEALGGVSYTSNASLPYRIVESVIGWKGATRVQEIYRSVRYS